MSFIVVYSGLLFIRKFALGFIRFSLDYHDHLVTYWNVEEIASREIKGVCCIQMPSDFVSSPLCERFIMKPVLGSSLESLFLSLYQRDWEPLKYKICSCKSHRLSQALTKRN